MHRVSPELLAELKKTFHSSGRINASEFVTALQLGLPDLTTVELLTIAAGVSNILAREVLAAEKSSRPEVI